MNKELELCVKWTSTIWNSNNNTTRQKRHKTTIKLTTLFNFIKQYKCYKDLTREEFEKEDFLENNEDMICEYLSLNYLPNHTGNKYYEFDEIIDYDFI